MKKRSILDTLFPVLPYAIYTIVTIIVFLLSPYTLHSDGISIMNLAMKWHNGLFMDAINSLWPPLISWFLAIIYFLPVDQVIGFKIAQIILGFTSLLLADRIAEKWIENRWVRFFILTGMALFFTEYTLRDTTADFIVVTTLLFYTWIVTGKDFLYKKWDGVALGALWALGYYARTYLIYFMGAHAVLLLAYKWWLARKTPEQQKTIVRNSIATFAVFAILSAPWLIALHAKYDRWMVGISGPYNYYKYNFEAVGLPRQNTYVGNTLIPPVSPNDTGILTNPDNQMPIPWSPFQSKAAFHYQVLKIWKNIKILFVGIQALNRVGIYDQFSVFMGACMFGFAAYIATRKEWWRDAKNVIIVSLQLLYPLGYLIIEVNDRYFYFCGALALLMGGYLLEKTLSNHKKVLYISACILMLSFIPFTPIKDLIAGYEFYSSMRTDGLYISSHLPTQGKRVATLGDTESKDFRIFYYAGLQYFWYLNVHVPNDRVLQQLCENKIDYALISTDNPAFASRNAFLEQYYSGKLQLPKHTEFTLLYNGHLPCPEQ